MKLTIRWLLFGTAVVGFLLAVAVRRNYLIACVANVGLLAVLIWSIVAGWLGPSNNRFWKAFAIGGWLYLLFVFGTYLWPERYQADFSPTNDLLEIAFAAANGDVEFDPRYARLSDTGVDMMSRFRPFWRIGHLTIAVLFGCATGFSLDPLWRRHDTRRIAG